MSDGPLLSSLDQQALRGHMDGALGEEYARERRDSPDIHGRIGRFRAAVQRKREKTSGTNHDNSYLNGDQMDILTRLENRIRATESDPASQAAEWVEYAASMLVRPQPGGYSPIVACSYAVRSLLIDVHAQGRGKNPLFNELLAIVFEVMFDLVTDMIAIRVLEGQPEDLIRKGAEESLRKLKPDLQQDIVKSINGFLGELEEDLMAELPKWKLSKGIKHATIANFSKSLGAELTEEITKALRKGTLQRDDLKDEYKMAVFVNELLEKRLPGSNILVDVPADKRGMEKQLAEKDAEIAQLKTQLASAGQTGDLKSGRQAGRNRQDNGPSRSMGA